MLDELTFRRNADLAIESLKKRLIEAEEDGGFEVEEQNGVLDTLPGWRRLYRDNVAVIYVRERLL